jgi:FAD:protein FMN transferase
MTSAADSPRSLASRGASGLPWTLLGLALVALVFRGCQEPAAPPATVDLFGLTMGTQYTVKLSELPDGLTREALQARVDQCLRTINQQMSTYLHDSELSRFNRHQDDAWFPVSADTAAVVATALDISRKTEGAFDVTVGPLVNLWSFGPEARPESPPADDQIEQARSRVGYQRLEARTEPPALRKTHPDVYVDLSAIAKGFAVDAVVDLLSRHGVPGFMVEIGGDLAARGTRPDGGPWRIGIERPITWGRALQQVIAMPQSALATSGDYRNYYQWEGRQYSHQIDPRTGYPVEHALASVSVIAENCMLADAWATALMVAGPEQAARLAEEYGLQIMLILRTEDGFENRMMGGFEQHLMP